MKEASALLNEKLKSITDIMASFEEEQSCVQCILFWCQYTEKVAILLQFTRVIQNKNRTLFLPAFEDMLSWFAASDHIKYI